MAVENISSTGYTNSVAKPVVKNNPGASDGDARLRTVGTSITPAAAQSSTSTNKLFRVPSNAIPKALNVWAADMSAGKWAFGLMTVDEKGSETIVDDNHLGHIDFGEGPYQGYNALYRDSAGGIAGTVAVADMDKPLWQTLGLTADPGVDYIVYGRCFENFSDATAIHTQLVFAV